MEESVFVKLPQMGEGVHEATLIKWLKKVGDFVQKDEPFLEVATDKVDTEIVAPSSGYVIAHFANPGQVLSVHQVLAQISPNPTSAIQQPEFAPSQKNASSSSAPSHKKTGPEFTPSQVSPQVSPGGAVGRSLQLAQYAGPLRSSPLVRKLAKEHGVSLADLEGSGLHGRITKEDLYRHFSSQLSTSAVTHTETSSPSLRTEQREGKEYLEGVQVERVKMDRIRRITAEHMLRSVRVSPHVTTTFEIDVSELGRIKKQLDGQTGNPKVSFTAFFIHATVLALKEYPMLNASVDGDEILLKKQINIACAVATDHGLLVPVLKDLNNSTLFEVAEKLNDLVRRARQKKLSVDDVQGGTFSITNPGIYGSLHSQPIINQPQVGILSMGAIVERPIFREGQLVAGSLAQVGLTFDHRIVDGEGGAKFLSSLKKHIESYKIPTV